MSSRADVFPECPPELEDWQPDPDLVPRPGKFIDKRFNKPKVSIEKEAALMRDARARESNTIGQRNPYAAYHAHLTARPVVKGEVIEQDRLYASAPRTSGQGSAVPPTQRKDASPPTYTPAAVSKAAPARTVIGTGEPVKESPIDLVARRSSVQVSAASAHMKVLTITDEKDRSQKTTTSTSFSKSISESSIPAWAMPLEKLLSEASKEERKPKTVSIPPHLRKKPDQLSVEESARKPNFWTDRQQVQELDECFRKASKTTRQLLGANSGASMSESSRAGDGNTRTVSDTQKASKFGAN